MAEDVVRVEDLCEELRESSVLTPPNLVTLPTATLTPRFKLIHVLYLDVLYKRIAVTRRAQIHSRIGECGEEGYGERAWEIAAELAVHFEYGRDLSRAVKYLQLAAENAAQRFANHEVVTLARRGLVLLRRCPKLLNATLTNLRCADSGSSVDGDQGFPASAVVEDVVKLRAAYMIYLL